MFGKRRAWGGGLLLLCALWLSGCAKPLVVEVVPVETRRLEVSFSERAETMLRRDFPVTLPKSGRIGRIDLEPGDRVRKGETLVSFDAVPMSAEVDAQAARVQAQRLQQAAMSDDTVELSEAEAARRRLQTVRAEQARSGPTIAAARTELANARKELDRVSSLVSNGALPAQQVETAQLAVDRAEAALSSRQAEQAMLKAREAEAAASVASWQARVERRQTEAAAQRAAVIEAESVQAKGEHELAQTPILSPIDGVVLSRELRGPQELPAGTLLLKLGRLEDLEAVCDVLSQDALRLHRGTPVILDPGTALPQPLHGEVRLKEPEGFTKRSSLGVEQQRVRVRIGLLDPPQDLGTGYELWARFLIQQKTALSLPTSCFVRQGDGYMVWLLRGKTLARVAVEVGTKGDTHWEVTGQALKEGDLVVRTPGEGLLEGAEVVVQPPASSSQAQS
jgi:HlyD family secretion protein